MDFIPSRHGLPDRSRANSAVHELKTGGQIIHTGRGDFVDEDLDDVFYGVPESVDDELFADLEVRLGT